MHDNLILDTILSLDTHWHCKSRRSKQFLEMERQMRGIWEICEGPTGNILRKLMLGHQCRVQLAQGTLENTQRGSLFKSPTMSE